MENKNFKWVIITVSLIIASAILWASALALKGRTGRVAESDGAAEPAKEAYNILLLGMDDSAGLCDVMMLLRVDFSAESVCVAQIPRDTYARFTESSYKKLNGAYTSLGGADKVAEFLSGALGVDIDHYVCVGLDTLGALVDAVGGIDVDVPRNMYYNDPYQGLYIDIKAGKNHLDGEAAQQFVRYRAGYADGDLGRMDAQKLFLASFFKKISDEYSPTLAARLALAADGVETDLSIADVISIGARAMEFSTRNMLMLTLPGGEAVAKKSGASYYVLSSQSCAEVMASYFGRKRDFDAEGSFLNEDYQSFTDIYRKRVEYSPVSVYDLIYGDV